MHDNNTHAYVSAGVNSSVNPFWDLGGRESGPRNFRFEL